MLLRICSRCCQALEARQTLGADLASQHGGSSCLQEPASLWDLSFNHHPYHCTGVDEELGSCLITEVSMHCHLPCTMV